MAALPHLTCVPIGRPLHLAAMVSYPAVDVAPAVAALLAQGRDPRAAGEDALPVAAAAASVGRIPEARALAWQGLLTFVGLKKGLPGLMAALPDAGRARDYLARHGRIEDLRRRRDAFDVLAGELRRVRAEEFNGYRALYFPDTEETVSTDAIPDYVRDRFRERDPNPPPFGFPVETSEWAGITEGDLRQELQDRGREAFDLDGLLVRSLAGFGPDARARVVEERRLWLIVGRWLRAAGIDADAEGEVGIALARWNAMQSIRSVRILRDVIVPTYDPVDRRKALQWCRRSALRIEREIQAASADWPYGPAG